MYILTQASHSSISFSVSSSLVEPRDFPISFLLFSMNKSCKSLPPFLSLHQSSSVLVHQRFPFMPLWRSGKAKSSHSHGPCRQAPSMTPSQAVSQFSPSLIPPESPSSPLSPVSSSPIHLSVSHWTRSPWRTETTSYFSLNAQDIWLPGTRQMLNVYICEMKEWVSKSVSESVKQSMNSFIPKV